MRLEEDKFQRLKAMELWLVLATVSKGPLLFLSHLLQFRLPSSEHGKSSQLPRSGAWTQVWLVLIQAPAQLAVDLTLSFYRAALLTAGSHLLSPHIRRDTPVPPPLPLRTAPLLTGPSEPCLTGNSP